MRWRMGEQHMVKMMKAINLQMFAMILALVVIGAFFSFYTDGAYLAPRNLSNLIRQVAITGILAIGMVFVIVSAEIDLSVGSMMGLLGGLVAIFDVWWGWPLPLTIVVTLIAGFLLGLWNGWWVAYQKVPSFIVTLAGMLAFRGILVGITEGTTIAPTNPDLNQIAQSYLPNIMGWGLGAILTVSIVWLTFKRRKNLTQHGLEKPPISIDFTKLALFVGLSFLVIGILNGYRGIPTPVMIMIVLVVIFTFMAAKTTFGRRVYAIGGNIEATRLSGVNVARTKLMIFALNGVLVAVAGLILTSRLGAGSPAAGEYAELDAIAACVIGGASLAGGVGTVFGAVIGALIMASLDNGMSMMDVPAFWQYIVKGMILLLAVWMDAITKKSRSV